MKKFATYTIYALYIYMACFFVFNGAFLHNHQIDGKTISHAHPFKGQEHTASVAFTIQLYNTTLGIKQSEILIPTNFITVLATVDSTVKENQTDCIIKKTTSRAPPYFC